MREIYRSSCLNIGRSVGRSVRPSAGRSVNPSAHCSDWQFDCMRPVGPLVDCDDWKSASSWRLHVAPLPVYRYQCFLPFFSQFCWSVHFICTPHQLKNDSDDSLLNYCLKRIVGVELKAKSDNVLLLCAYMPFFDSSRRTECLAEKMVAVTMIEMIIENHPINQ